MGNLYEEIMSANIDEEKLKIILGEIEEEFRRASKLHAKMNTPHEGYAILKEEVDELWDIVKRKELFRGRNDQLHAECIQVGAMAMRFLHDTVDYDSKK